MENSMQFREDIRLLVRKLGILDKVAHNKSNEITLPQCHALIEIGRAQKLSLKELAGKLNLDVSSTSRTVDQLVKKDLAMRSISSNDRRSIEISLSEHGKGQFKDIEDTMHLYYSRIFKQIPSDKQQQVLESLGLILDALSMESGEVNGSCRKS